MVLGATADDLVAFVGEGIGHGCCVGFDASLICFEFGSQGFAERYGLGCDYMLERTALNSGKHSRVDQLRHLAHLALGVGLAPGIVEILAEQDDAAARTAEGLVGCRGDDVGIFERVVEQTGGDKTCGMGHVDHKYCSDLVGDLAHAGIVPFA